MAPYRPLPILLACLISGHALAQKTVDGGRPNILLIYADDLGFGDVSVQGGRIPTPHIDRLASKGIRFTNAHSPASTCTPSRYALLTGEYAFRRRGTGVANGDAGLIIPADRETLPRMLKRAGYRTAVVGKWHLGLGGPGGPDWNGPIKPGPAELGFDKSFIMPSTGDRVPCVYVEDGRVVGLSPDDPIKVDYRRNIGEAPTGRDSPDLLRMGFTHGHDQSIVNGIPRIGYMTGGAAALWRDEDIADDLFEKAREFIIDSRGSPFFLFFSAHDIHVPRAPHERYRGRSGFGPRGDALIQFDETVGRLDSLVQSLGLSGSTLVVLTSDNGPVLDDGYADGAEERRGDHDPNGGLRGGKYGAYEAGTRVPMIVSQPGRVRHGGVSDALFTQTDLLASLASHLGQPFDRAQARDSEDHWETLTGRSRKGRSDILEEAVSGVVALLRADGCKYIPASDGPARLSWAPGIETGFRKEEQLYRLSVDRGESRNLVASRPGLLQRMRRRWEMLRL